MYHHIQGTGVSSLKFCHNPHFHEGVSLLVLLFLFTLLLIIILQKTLSCVFVTG